MQNCQDTFSATFTSYNELWSVPAASGAIAQSISSMWSR